MGSTIEAREYQYEGVFQGYTGYQGGRHRQRSTYRNASPHGIHERARAFRNILLYESPPINHNCYALNKERRQYSSGCFA